MAFIKNHWKALVVAGAMFLTGFYIGDQVAFAQFPPGYNGPVFDGEGLTGGALQAELGITGNISKEKSLIKLIAAWIRFLLPILAFAAVVAIIYAGYTYVTGGGEDGRYDKAKQIVLWVVIGLILALGAYAIINTVLDGVT